MPFMLALKLRCKQMWAWLRNRDVVFVKDVKTDKVFIAIAYRPWDPFKDPPLMVKLAGKPHVLRSDGRIAEEDMMSWVPGGHRREPMLRTTHLWRYASVSKDAMMKLRGEDMPDGN